MKLRHFKPEEFNDFDKMNPELLALLDELREKYGYPIKITSDYRSPDHPIEKSKPNGPGSHTDGDAVDIASIGGEATFNLVRAAIDAGFKRIGISRKNNFLHIDIGDRTKGKVVSIWTY